MTSNEIHSVLDQIKFRDWVFHLDADGGWLQVRFVADGAEQQGRKWRLSPFMTKSEVVQTALAAVLFATEHEAREAFMYRGRAVFGPHFNIDRLVDLCEGGYLDVRAA